MQTFSKLGSSSLYKSQSPFQYLRLSFQLLLKNGKEALSEIKHNQLQFVSIISMCMTSVCTVL